MSFFQPAPSKLCVSSTGLSVIKSFVEEKQRESQSRLKVPKNSTNVRERKYSGKSSSGNTSSKTAEDIEELKQLG